jgi:D-3-phosphoglycerate dehydrogenase
MMKPTAVVVNTARGGIVNEVALLKALHSQTIAAAALDVFAEEPYRGELAKLPNVLLTCHMGSMTADCRARMEIEATQEAIRVLYGEPLRSPVPAEEYDIAERLARN